MLSKISLIIAGITGLLIIIGMGSLYFVDIPPPKMQSEIPLAMPKPKVNL